jgi:chromosome segregation ATPase
MSNPVRITDTQRRDIEERLRRAARALLRGDLPPGGKADITTLTQMAGISRAALYRSYPHIKAEFDQQLAELRTAGQAPDPRDAQIQRLKHQNADLKRRIGENETALTEHQRFKTLALSRLAAQHEEIQRLRQVAEATTRKGCVRQLPARPASGLTGPC